MEKFYQPSEDEIKKAESVEKEKIEEFFKQLEKQGIKTGDRVLVDTSSLDTFFNEKDTKYILWSVDKEKGIINLMKDDGGSYDFSPMEGLSVLEIHNIRKTESNF